MTFPVDESTTGTAFAVAGTSHTMNYPATVNAGDLLLMFFSTNDGAVITIPSGYTELDQQQGATPSIRQGIFAKIATGSEAGGTEVVTISPSKTACGQIRRVSGWGGNIATGIDISTYVTGIGAVPNPGSVTAGWGANDNLFLSCVGAADDDESASNDPSGFAGLSSTVSGGGTNNGCTVGSARKYDTGATLDPATWTLSGSEEWVTWTLVIAPVGALGGTIVPHTMHHYRNHGKIF